jgi:PKD repeat protein
MKKQFLLVFVLIISGYISFAGPVGQQKAQAIALNYFNLNYPDVAAHTPLTATLKYTQTEADNTVDFYVFDIYPAHGFVIVAADDIIIPILAYSNESYFNPNFKLSGLNNWVKKTAANIHLAIQAQVLAGPEIVNQWSAYAQGVKPVNTKSAGATVGPLCATTWDQENDISNPPPYIYNLLCPWYAPDQQRALTGCVATAQAQVMKYWNYPAKGAGSFYYVDDTANYFSNNYGPQSSNFAAHTYQWPLMPSVLTGDEPLAQDSAVDVLMYDCAVSVEMDFGDDNQDGSGANALISEEITNVGDSFCSQYALGTYFAYNWDTMSGIYEANYSAAAWTAVIEHEMNVGRPVMYEGNDTTQGGHCWVCDGYDADNNLHMNWGWSGFDNGFFAINNLTTSGNFNPILGDDALIGIMPKYPRAPIAGFVASLTNTCNGTIQFQDLSQDLPTSWLWNFGDGATSTLQNPVHTYTANGTYSITLTATNPAGSTPVTVTHYITVNMLTAPTASNVSAAAPQSFTLTATTSGTVGWFDANGALVSGANPFITPVLNTTTTYYVEDSVVSPSTHVGAVNKQIGAGGYVTDPYAMQFNVLNPCVIQSVYVYAQSAAERTIQVLDSMGKVVAQNTVYCPAGGSRALVNLSLDAGGPYFMQVGDTLGLYSNTAGVNYPYADSLGLVQITGNNAYDPTQYFYFYDWVVKAPDCVSPRVPVTASVLTGINEADNVIRFKMYPNPAANQVMVQFDNLNTPTTINLTNILGQTVIAKNVTDAQTVVDLSALSNGVYLMQLRQGEKFAVKQLVIAK